jgi:hypothetical protein
MKEFASQMKFNDIYIAVGEGLNGCEFAYILPGAVLASKTSSQVVLVNKKLSAEVANFLKSKVSIASRVTAFGGPAVVPATILETITSYISQVKVSADYKKAGTYGPEQDSGIVKGNVIISTSDVTLQNTIIEGDLLLTEGIGDGNVTLKNVTVKGDTTVRGGGPNSVVMYNFNGQRVTVDVPDGGNVRLVAQGATSVQSVEMQSNGKLEESNVTGSGFTTVVIPEGATVTLAGDFDAVGVEASDAKVNITSGSIGKFNVAESAANSNIEVTIGAKITTLEANAPVSVTGAGTIATANIKSNGVTIAQTPSTTTVDKDVTANVGGKDVTSETPVTPPLTDGGSGVVTPTKGTILLAQELNGGPDATSTLNGYTFTIGGKIAYCQSGGELNIPIAGDWVGVRITAPTGITPDENALLTINGSAGEPGWNNIKEPGDEANSFHIYIRVRNIARVYNITIKWNNQLTESYVVNFAPTTTLEVYRTVLGDTISGANQIYNDTSADTNITAEAREALLSAIESAQIVYDNAVNATTDAVQTGVNEAAELLNNAIGAYWDAYPTEITAVSNNIAANTEYTDADPLVVDLVINGVGDFVTENTNYITLGGDLYGMTIKSATFGYGQGIGADRVTLELTGTTEDSVDNKTITIEQGGINGHSHGFDVVWQ